MGGVQVGRGGGREKGDGGECSVNGGDFHQYAELWYPDNTNLRQLSLKTVSWGAGQFVNFLGIIDIRP